MHIKTLNSRTTGYYANCTQVFWYFESVGWTKVMLEYWYLLKTYEEDLMEAQEEVLELQRVISELRIEKTRLMRANCRKRRNKWLITENLS